MTRTLALDPALSCGWAYHDGTDMSSGVWHLKASGSEHAGAPLARLESFIVKLHGEHGIDRIVFENASQGSHHEQVKVFHNRVSGVILATASKLGCTWDQYVPSTIKAFAGHGRYKKHQMIESLKRHYGIEVRNEDEADAIWVLLLDRDRRRGGPTAVKVKAAKTKPSKPKERRLF